MKKKKLVKRIKVLEDRVYNLENPPIYIYSGSFNITDGDSSTVTNSPVCLHDNCPECKGIGTRCDGSLSYTLNFDKS